MFFSFVIDVFSRKVVGWQLASHMRTDLVLDALRMALGTREPGADFALVAHTDRGSQYTSARLHPDARRSRRPRVGRIGRRRLRQRARRELRRQLQDRADRRPRLAHPHASSSSPSSNTSRWFNHDRLHDALGDIPPAEFESSTSPAAADGAGIWLNESTSKPTNPLSVKAGPAQPMALPVHASGGRADIDSVAASLGA